MSDSDVVLFSDNLTVDAVPKSKPGLVNRTEQNTTNRTINNKIFKFSERYPNRTILCSEQMNATWTERFNGLNKWAKPEQNKLEGNYTWTKPEQNNMIWCTWTEQNRTEQNIIVFFKISTMLILDFWLNSIFNFYLGRYVLLFVNFSQSHNITYYCCVFEI